jgi:hypothetical protein
MARKTRRQKERAVKRRLQEQSMPGVVKREFEFEFKSSDSKLNNFSNFKQVDKSFYSEDISFITRDLTKTVILAVGILTLEIMIYWAWFK